MFTVRVHHCDGRQWILYFETVELPLKLTLAKQSTHAIPEKTNTSVNSTQDEPKTLWEWASHLFHPCHPPASIYQ